MGRNSKSFERKKPSFKAEPKILVLCEDLKSSKCYLEDAAEHFRAHADIDFAHCGVTHPLGIVEEGIRRSNSYNHVYCVIDRDTHESFEKALNLASNSKKLTVIPSYPCFEFWLILHFGHCRKPFNRTGKKSPGDEAVAHLRRLPDMQDYNKGTKFRPFKLLLGERFSKARRLSPQILAQAQLDGDLNPSTEIHLLIDVFETLSAPQLLDT